MEQFGLNSPPKTVKRETGKGKGKADLLASMHAGPASPLGSPPPRASTPPPKSPGARALHDALSQASEDLPVHVSSRLYPEREGSLRMGIAEGREATEVRLSLDTLSLSLALTLI